MLRHGCKARAVPPRNRHAAQPIRLCQHRAPLATLSRPAHASASTGTGPTSASECPSANTSRGSVPAGPIASQRPSHKTTFSTTNAPSATLPNGRAVYVPACRPCTIANAPLSRNRASPSATETVARKDREFQGTACNRVSPAPSLINVLPCGACAASGAAGPLLAPSPCASGPLSPASSLLSLSIEGKFANRPAVSCPVSRLPPTSLAPATNFPPAPHPVPTPSCPRVLHTSSTCPCNVLAARRKYARQ